MEQDSWPQYRKRGAKWSVGEVVACAAAVVVGLPIAAALLVGAESDKREQRATLEPLVLPTVVVSAKRASPASEVTASKVDVRSIDP